MKHGPNIIKLRSEGKSYREIQEQLKCSKGTIAYHLGKGQKEKTRRNSQIQRQAIQDKLNSIKESSGCTDCKVKYPYYMLDFDHISNDKIANVSDMAKLFPIKTVLEEVGKCEVVCANCHRKRTHQRKRATA